MGSLRIGSVSTPALAAQHDLSMSTAQLEHSLRALSSGQRIVSSGDDPAGFAIGESLRAQISGDKQAKSNALEAQSLIQVAEGSLNEQNNILIRLREIGVQSASDTISDTEREFLNQEFTQLATELDRIAQTTRYGTQNLLNGSGRTYSFQVGAYGDNDNRIEYTLKTNTTASSLGVKGLDVSDKDSARDSLDSIDEAVNKISGARANLGAIQSRLQIAEEHASGEFENLSEARSRIVDTDVAEETSNLARHQVMQQAATAVLAQANATTERALKLLL